ncbi:Mobile element protein [Fimbriiglobus ruber]|uniref:Mobile element protein n=1 Tax=Fimbriiglobus ruber TaxID=1908690 RepID=A0A225DED8_9BACT|nr:Mobile element protein [Fimbriiglobus ruber]
MTDANALLVTANLKTLKLPALRAEWDQLAREAAAADEPYDAYLVRLTEVEVTARAANAVAARIRAAGFPVVKDLDTFDFTACPSVPTHKILELARGGVGRPTYQHVSDRGFRNWEDALGDGPRTRPRSGRPAGPVRDRGRTRHPVGEGPAGTPPGSDADHPRPPRHADRR